MNGGGERCCSLVRRMVLVYLAEEFPGCMVVSVGCWSGELLHEPVSNIAAVRVNPSIGGYSLVAVLVGQIHRTGP